MNRFAVFLAGLILLTAVAAGAEQKKMYRYTDDKGKRLFVPSFKDVPERYRPSASAVVKGEEEEAAPTESEDTSVKKSNGKEVEVLSLALTANGDGMAAFKGQVRNNAKSKVENVVLHVEAMTAEGKKNAEARAGDNGAIAAGDSYNVTVNLGVPAAAVSGYSYNLTWQTTKMEAVKEAPPAGTKNGGYPATGK